MTDDRAERFADAAVAAGGCPNCGEIGPCACDPRTAAKRDVADAFRQIARKAVDEVLGPDGPGPFPSGSGATRGGRAEVFGIFDRTDGTWVWPDPGLVDGDWCAFGLEGQAGAWNKQEAERIARVLTSEAELPGLQVRPLNRAGSMPVAHTEDGGR